MSASQKCHAFTQKHGGRVNRILTEVHISLAFSPKNQPADVQLHKTRALWDTGASHSVITESTAKALGLTPTGKRIIQHAGGQGEYNTYVVNFYLPNQVAIGGVLVSECPDNDGSFGAIIGMDIICDGDFSISNHQGQTWVTFRYPSLQATDYVADFERLPKPRPGAVKERPLIQPGVAIPKVGRNELCPCKSGRKYKKCHGF
jgi:hypothetical protein